jgi:acetyl esterase
MVSEHRPIAQLLIYPATDFHSERRSHEIFAEGFYLTGADVEAFRGAYLAGADVSVDDPRVSPLRAGTFSGLPPTLIAIAGFDPLRDDAEAYVEALRGAGVPVRVHRFPGLGHGFIHMTGVASAARRAMATIAGEWRELAGTSQSAGSGVRASDHRSR